MMGTRISRAAVVRALTCLIGALLAISAAAGESEVQVGAGPVAGGNTAATVRCTSAIGERQHCAADTSAGVMLARSIGPGACLLGKTWGYDDAGIWVTDGCGGEFIVRQTVPTPTQPAGAVAPVNR